MCQRLPKVIWLTLVAGLAACRPQAATPAMMSPSPTWTAASPSPQPEDPIGCVITTPPPELALDPFYEKYCDADGIPIISSDDVADLAFHEAYDVITNMLAPIPVVRQAFIREHATFAITPKAVGITTLPEYSHMDSAYWDLRARGLGGTIWSPITAGPEENLLCLGRDRNYGESISVHEFAHAIHLIGLIQIEPDFDILLRGLYNIAMEKKLWLGTYVQTGYTEYWAEGVQSYFNTNLEADPPDGIHNLVDTRAELAEYDPLLFALIDAIFDGYEWMPTCPD